MLGLDSLLARFPRRLSGGQRQRVAMGRAMVRDPKGFLFDEPLSNLDARLRVQMRSELEQHHQRLKTTTVHGTHDQIEAMTMADRIVVMHDGVVERIGTPLELCDTPANLFVTGFIGSPAMNVIGGSVAGGVFVAPDGTRVAIAQAAPEGAEAALGARPEHVRIDPQGIAAEVVTVEPTGPETQVDLRLGGGDVVGAFRERIAAKPGDRLPVSLDPARLHLFGAASGRRMAA
jgi:multiple sugar transport system ATP-binding protein